MAPFNQKAFYTFRPNIELGKGFADISIVGGKKSKRKLAAIIEIKHSSCENDLIKEAKKALETNKEQIEVTKKNKDIIKNSIRVYFSDIEKDGYNIKIYLMKYNLTK